MYIFCQHAEPTSLQMSSYTFFFCVRKSVLRDNVQYRKGTSIRQASVFRHLRALRKSPWKFIIWIKNYNYTACCWFPTCSSILILPSQFWQIRFESCWLQCSKCRILVLLRYLLYIFPIIIKDKVQVCKLKCWRQQPFYWPCFSTEGCFYRIWQIDKDPLHVERTHHSFTVCMHQYNNLHPTELVP